MQLTSVSFTKRLSGKLQLKNETKLSLTNTTRTNIFTINGIIKEDDFKGIKTSPEMIGKI
jgi:hypothetical protein